MDRHGRDPLMRLCTFARWECLTILAAGLLLTAAVGVLGWWLWLPLPVVLTLAVVMFFRDPNRRAPAERNAWVAVADGKVTSVHEVDACEPLGEPALCVRVFISLLNVHVFRSPCHARLRETIERPGRFRNALGTSHLEQNTAQTLVLEHPVREQPIAVVRLIAGAVARTIHTPVKPATTLQRGERMGIIKLGSTAELYIPTSLEPQVMVMVGDRVRAGQSVLVRLGRRQGEARATTTQASNTPNSQTTDAPVTHRDPAGSSNSIDPGASTNDTAGNAPAEQPQSASSLH